MVSPAYRGSDRSFRVEFRCPRCQFVWRGGIRPGSTTLERPCPNCRSIAVQPYRDCRSHVGWPESYQSPGPFVSPAATDEPAAEPNDSEPWTRARRAGRLVRDSLISVVSFAVLVAIVFLFVASFWPAMLLGPAERFVYRRK